jgi:membrane protein required for beta-lactamase induction
LSDLPDWQAARLAVLLDALAGCPVSDGERATLTWLAGFEVDTVENLAAVIRRARSVGPC